MWPDPGVPPLEPDLRFLASVALRFEAPLAVGEAPDGVRFDFKVHGTVTGPALNGKFPTCAAYLLVDLDGIGTINVRAPLLLHDGAIAELEATGRYDFGEDGYRRAVAKDLPNSALGWCPRFLTGDPRYQWLNRTLCLGVGELRPRETRIDYDLFAVSPSPETGARSEQASLYQRIGGRDVIAKVMIAFVRALHGNAELDRQNPRIGAALARLDARVLEQQVTDFVCQLAGGPRTYTGRTMKASHAHLAITEADWTVAAGILSNVLNAQRIPATEQAELMELIATLKDDVVIAGRQALTPPG